MCDIERGSRPLAHATCREEELGGGMAAFGRRLGGHNVPASGMQTLLKLCARYKVPDIGMAR
eukprot:5501154-Lingulodinium_polyedra.AAC.1